MWDDGEKILAKDKHLGSLVKKYGKCNLIPSSKEDYFSDVVESITGQQLSVKAAATIYARLEAYCKDLVTPDKLLTISSEKLREIGYSRQKILYLKDLSKNVIGRPVEFEKLDKLQDEKIVEEMTKVKGIGVWTVEMFLIFSLCRKDVFPIKDLALKKAFYKIVREMPDKDILEFADRWRPNRTLASWYLWKSL